MNLFKKLLKKKDNETNATAHTVDLPIYPSTYIVGWEIHTNSGTMLSRKYNDVPENERIETYNIIQKEVENMYKALNEAAKKKNEFVKLEGNLLRLSDVSKICAINMPQSHK